jgi:hypothetical protein
VFKAFTAGGGSGEQLHHKGRRSVRRRFAILFAAAFASISGVAACGGVQEEVQKRAEEEVEKGREQVEQEVQEGRTQIEQEVQEERTQIEEAVEGQ